MGLFCLGLGSYAGIGFVPYSAFRPGEGRGILVLAEYPRLWLMCILFFVALAAAFRKYRGRAIGATSPAGPEAGISRNRV